MLTFFWQRMHEDPRIDELAARVFVGIGNEYRAILMGHALKAEPWSVDRMRDIWTSAGLPKPDRKVIESHLELLTDAGLARRTRASAYQIDGDGQEYGRPAAKHLLAILSGQSDMPSTMRSWLGLPQQQGIYTTAVMLYHLVGSDIPNDARQDEEPEEPPEPLAFALTQREIERATPMNIRWALLVDQACRSLPPEREHNPAPDTQPRPSYTLQQLADLVNISPGNAGRRIVTWQQQGLVEYQRLDTAHGERISFSWNGKQYRDGDLTGPRKEYHVAACIAAHRHELPATFTSTHVHELAGITGAQSAATINRAIRLLETEGYIAREGDWHGHKQYSRISLTDKGMALAQSIFVPIMHLCEGKDVSLDAMNMAQLHAYMPRLMNKPSRL